MPLVAMGIGLMASWICEDGRDGQSRQGESAIRRKTVLKHEPIVDRPTSLPA